MRSKTPLVLMEQLVMVLVFALAAAMCLRMFAVSDRISRKNEAVTQAALLSQNVAEQIKSHGGTISIMFSEDKTEFEDTCNQTSEWKVGDGFYFQEYDKNWGLLAADTENVAAYRLEVREENTEVPGLLRARITVTGAGEALFEIPVAWQEVRAHE